MIVDSSALVAVLRQERDSTTYDRALAEAGGARMSAANYVETSLVIDGRRDPVMSHELDRYLSTMRVEVVAITVVRTHLGRAAHRDHGRSSEHPAKLNLGDCFACALAKDTGEPLLSTGDDFSDTDVIAAVRPR